MAYYDIKASQKPFDSHPSEEEIACFLEGKLDPERAAGIKAHLAACDPCAGLVSDDLELSAEGEMEVPESLLARVREMIAAKCQTSALDIILKSTEQGFEIISTTGNVLFGNEFVPAVSLRSGKNPFFKDDLVIAKDFELLSIEVKVENVREAGFNLVISGKEKNSCMLMKDTRVTLLKDNLELESRISEKGRVVFENVYAGKYSIEISNIKQVLATISVEVMA